jgi:hypothetical protein
MWFDEISNLELRFIIGDSSLHIPYNFQPAVLGVVSWRDLGNLSGRFINGIYEIGQGQESFCMTREFYRHLNVRRGGSGVYGRLPL